MLKEEIIERNSIATKETDFENIEPLPDRIHGTVKGEIIFQLKSAYGDQFQIVVGMTLDTTPPTTPDILIYPKKQLNWIRTEVAEKEIPIAIVEVLAHREIIDKLAAKVWNIYFPKGVKSAWIVVPQLKTITILLPDDEQLLFSQGKLKDPVTGIELSVEKIFDCLV